MGEKVAEPRSINDRKTERIGISSYFKHLFRGIRVIAKWEFIQNLKTVRMLVLIIIFSLVMLGGSYGLTTFFTQAPGEISFKIPEEIIKEAMGNVFISAHVLDLDGEGYANDVMIFTYYGNGDPAAKKKFTVFETWGEDIPGGFNRTNLSGISVYYNLPAKEYEVNLEPATASSSFKIEKNITNYSDISLEISPIFDLKLEEISLGKETDLNDLLGDYRQVGVIVHVVDHSGNLYDDAEIFINDEQYGITNSTGTLPVNMEPGNYTIKAFNSGSYSPIADVTIKEPPVIKKEDTSLSGLPVNLGPDFVIIIVASIASFIVSLSAIVLSFDAISREKADKSLDILLTKPFPRESVILGKYLGITGAMTAPFVVVLFGAVWIMSLVSDKWPSPSVIITFIGLMVLLIAIYIAIEIFVSILAKTTGTAILAGIGIWVLLNMLWGVLGLGISELFGLETVSVSNFMSLLNPSDLFLVCLSIVSKDALIASIGAEELTNSFDIRFAYANWVFFLTFGL
ncbi:MAG: ABC transporter permease subunit, partial [Candidatus Thermoplasmatota archaeon]|nr:ABC transporter permease subunit [Candidatus Thermoplasmatota archaeon]